MATTYERKTSYGVVCMPYSPDNDYCRDYRVYAGNAETNESYLRHRGEGVAFRYRDEGGRTRETYLDPQIGIYSDRDTALRRAAERIVASETTCRGQQHCEVFDRAIETLGR